MTVEQLIIDKLDLWTSATTHKATSGRGRNGKLELTGLKKLRELILELAVRGKLVPQDPTDEPASVLLEKIAAEKARLVKEGKIKKPKALPEIAEDEKPFELPNGWEWVRLGEIFEVTSSKRIHVRDYVDSGIPFFRSKEIGELQSGKKISTDIFISEEKYRELQHLPGFPMPGDLMLTSVGSIGNNWICDSRKFYYKDGNITKISANRYFLIRLLQEFINSPMFERSATSTVSGTAYNALTIIKLNNILLPLSPLNEQSRIVEKVDELMGLCDRIENRTLDHLAAHETLVDTLLGTLTQADSAAELADNWGRLATHFDTLFTTEHSIDRLKQTILQLAVMGRLVPQDPTDEPATSKYMQVVKMPEGYIRSKKQQIVEKDLSDLNKMPSIPQTWAYRRIDDLYNTNHILDYADGNHGSLYPRKSDFGTDGILFLTATQIDDLGRIDWENCPRLDSEKAKDLTKGWSTNGDVYFTHNATVGRTAISTGCPDSVFLLGTSVTFYRINNDEISRRYLYHYFSSNSWQSQASSVMQQTTRNQVSITKQALFYVALPPLAEQHRIVQKVDALMALCDQLKARLAQADDTRRHLATALVAQAIH